MLHLPALLAKRVRLSSGSLQAVRAYAGYWHKDWIPGPYPETQEQRRAAAKKYGMIPEDYEPYPNDGLGYGDYPKLPIVSAESRDPFIDYDMDEFKRNYGEPLHIDCDMYGEDRWDYSKRLRYSLTFMNCMFFGVIGTIALFAYLSEKYLRFCTVRMMPKHMPGDGKKHYTFELKGDDHTC